MISIIETRIEKHKQALEVLDAIDSYEILLEQYEKELLKFKPATFIFIESKEDLIGEILDTKEKIKKLEDKYIVINEAF